MRFHTGKPESLSWVDFLVDDIFISPISPGVTVLINFIAFYK
jgi:hypothetical protein